MINECVMNACYTLTLDSISQSTFLSTTLGLLWRASLWGIHLPYTCEAHETLQILKQPALVYVYTSVCINHSITLASTQTASTCVCVYIPCMHTHLQVLRICACTSASHMLPVILHVCRWWKMYSCIYGPPKQMMHAKCTCMRVKQCSCIHDLSIQYQHHRSMPEHFLRMQICIHVLPWPRLILWISSSALCVYAKLHDFVCMWICTHKNVDLEHVCVPEARVRLRVYVNLHTSKCWSWPHKHVYALESMRICTHWCWFGPHKH